MVVAVGLAYLAADVLSGLVHAVCDNLGSVDTPVVGQKFIRSFREHHTDPLDMTRGDFVRVNADNFLVCLPVLDPRAALGGRQHATCSRPRSCWPSPASWS